MVFSASRIIVFDEVILLFFFFCPFSQQGPALKEEALLLQEQILFMKGGPHLEKLQLQRRKQKLMLFPFVKLMNKHEG